MIRLGQIQEVSRGQGKTGDLDDGRPLWG